MSSPLPDEPQADRPHAGRPLGDDAADPGAGGSAEDPESQAERAAEAATWLGACRKAEARGESTSDVGAVPIGDPELARVADAVTAAVNGFLGTELVGRDGGDLLELAVAIQGQMQRLTVGSAGVVAAYEQSREWELKAGSAPARLAHRGRLPIEEQRAAVKMARQLAVMPLVAEAAEAGEIGVCHVRRLGRLASNRRVRDVFARDEELLVGFARTLEWTEFKERVDYWEQCADPDGAEDNAAVDEAKRRVHLSDGLDGTAFLDGQLTPAANAAVSGALKHFDGELFQEEWDDARERLGREPSIEDLERTPAQRRHDALQRMAEQSMARLDGTRPAPLISVVTDFESLAGRISKLEQTGIVVPPGTLARLMVERDVLIEQAVQDAKTQRLGLSDRRLFTGKARRKVQLRDQKCAWPGCHEPAVNCQIDHIVEYCEGGETVEENGQPLCPRHNRLKERIRRLMRRRRHRQAREPGRRTGSQPPGPQGSLPYRPREPDPPG